LYHTNWILTAAHCFVKPKPIEYFTVVAGEHVIGKTEGSEQTSTVQKIFLHKYYDRCVGQIKYNFMQNYSLIFSFIQIFRKTRQNDIAYLKLSTVFQETEFVKKVTLDISSSRPSPGEVGLGIVE